MVEGSYQIEVSVIGLDAAKREIASVGDASQSVSTALESVTREGEKAGETLTEVGKDGAAGLTKTARTAEALAKELQKVEATAKRMPSNLLPLTSGRVPGSGVRFDPLPAYTRSPALQAAYDAAERAKAERDALAALAANSNIPRSAGGSGGSGGGAGGGSAASAAAASFEKANASAMGFGRTISGFVTPVVAALAGVVAGSLIKSFTEFSDKVAQSKKDLEDFGNLGSKTGEIIKQLDETARGMGASLDKVSDPFLRIQDYAIQPGKLSRTPAEAAGALDTLTKSMQASGAAGEAISRVLRQVSGDAEENTLSVRSLDAIYDQSRGTVERLAQSMGMNMRTFRDSVKAGAVTFGEFVDAFNRPTIKNAVAEELKRIEERGKPVSQSVDLISNSLLRLGSSITSNTGLQKWLSDTSTSFSDFVAKTEQDAARLDTASRVATGALAGMMAGAAAGATVGALGGPVGVLGGAAIGGISGAGLGAELGFGYDYLASQPTPQLTPGQLSTLNAMQRGGGMGVGVISGSEGTDQLIGLTETSVDLLGQISEGIFTGTVSYKDANGNIVSELKRNSDRQLQAANQNLSGLQQLGTSFERAVESLGQSFDSAVRNFQQSSAFGSSPGGGGGYVIPSYDRMRQLDVRGAYAYGPGNYEIYWQTDSKYVSQELRPTASYLANERYINADKVLRDYRYGVGTAEQALKSLKQLGFNPDAPMYKDLRDAAAGLNDASKNLNGASDHLSAFGAGELYGVGNAVAPTSLGNLMRGLGAVTGGSTAGSTTVNVNMTVNGVTDADSFNKSAGQIVDELTSTLWRRVA
ncbi:tape measure protein [Alsobacter sp. SYSU M60028]|uniref:Tape measure protein n=1 Tax=Alsobacter ponti TaxID=2962936 RepID=A0ABT1LD08_9HYPH|nr:tape measure protein [Alsobacter ponti]MCP8939391.1 tape measure protein [Alsobacter ponti]